MGDCFLILMLLAVALKVNRQLAQQSTYALIRFAVVLVTVIANFSESHFGRMSPLGFLFLLAAIDARPGAVPSARKQDYRSTGDNRKVPLKPTYQHAAR